MTGENLDILELARQAKALHAKSVWHGEDSDDAATVLFALASAVETLTREKDQLRYDFVDAAVAEAQLKEQAIKRAEAAEARLAEVERERDEADDVIFDFWGPKWIGRDAERINHSIERCRARTTRIER